MPTKIIIGIFASTKEEAIKNCHNLTKINEGYDSSNSDVILELPFCLFVMINKSGGYCGHRVHFIYADKEDTKTEAFQQIALPMLCCGLGII